MARVTVEDCVLKVPNRFELVMLAAQRARDISAGSALTVDRDNDKNPVVSLREIADTTIDLEALNQSLIKGLQKVAEVDEPTEDEGSFGEGTELLNDIMETLPEGDGQDEGDLEEDADEASDLDVPNEDGQEGTDQGGRPE